MDSVDCIVIGAGVVGLAVARELALRGREVMVLEQEGAIGQGISSRNSEVIHAGLYYPTQSLKASLCVQGKALLYAYAKERGIAHRQCGKLIVATDDSQLQKLALLEQQAQLNDVPTEQLTREQARLLEPALECVAALHSPSTGIIDSHALMLSLQGDLENAGGTVVTSTQVKNIRFLDTKSSKSSVLRAGTAPKKGAFILPSDDFEIAFTSLVNAAGLSAPLLAQRIEGLEAAHVPQAFYAKGNYFSLIGKAPFSRLIYPLPQAAGLGVHLTLDLAGQAKFGPDVQWLDSVAQPDQIDYAVDASRSAAFEAEVRKYWPDLPRNALAPSYSGVRPKISAAHEAAADFVIQGQQVHGLPGLVNLFGIESPGLTSSLAIAKTVASMLSK